MTDLADLMVTMQLVPETASQPLQRVKRMSGLAVSVTTLSMVYDSEQSVPQLIPDGFEVTLPWSAPRPALLTVSVKRFSSKVAVTVRAALTVTVHVEPETTSHPLQPAKVERLSALGVSVTLLPTSKSAEHCVPQVIPGGFEITLPDPVPARMTERAAR